MTHITFSPNYSNIFCKQLSKNLQMVQLAPLITHITVFLGSVGLKHRMVQLTPPRIYE